MGRVVAVALGVLALLLGAAAPAQAHPTVLVTTPEAESAVVDSPVAVTVAFNEPVVVGRRALTVLDATGRTYPVDPPTLLRGGTALTARLGQGLPPSTYTVRWQVTGTDGDLVEEEFRFAVGTALSGAAASSGDGAVSWPTAVLRWALFAGLAVAAGGVVAERLTRSALVENPALPRLRSWAGSGAWAGVVAAAGLGAMLAADSGAVEVLWAQRIGQVLLVEVAGFAAAAAALAAGRRTAALAPLALVVLADGLRSHLSVAAPGWGALLTAVHLAAAALWAGALLHTARAAWAWRSRRAAVSWVVLGYARMAGWLFTAVVVTGSVSALVLVPAADLLTSTYGTVLLIKIGLVAVAAALALTARLTLRHPARRQGRVRRLARTESGVLVGVLALAAALVSTAPPGAVPPSAPPPAPVGMVVPLGTLAGQVGVRIAASDDQLVVRLATPQLGDPYGPKPRQDYRLAGQLTRPDGSAQPLGFRVCGDGCFVAAAPWAVGNNALGLRVTAPGWVGGPVGMVVPWPVRPGDGPLAAAVAALRAIPTLTIYEAVTSDTSSAPPEAQALSIPASMFLSGEPYAAGTAPIAVQTSREGEPVHLALGFPAAKVNAQLVLDERGRISEETLADESHLIRRRIVYPER